MYLHDRGIIHKDIKPGNILVHGDGRILLADFDLSRDTTLASVSISTRTGGAGTLGYIAPEVQVRGGGRISDRGDTMMVASKYIGAR